MCDAKCKWYYEGKHECCKMTLLLQEAGVVGFHAKLQNQKRDCKGNYIACYFQNSSGYEPKGVPKTLTQEAVDLMKEGKL